MSAFIDWLTRLLQKTAIPMTRPEAYGTFHLTFALVGFCLVFLLAWRLGRLGKEKCKWLLFGVGVFLFLCELYKQLFHVYCMEEIGTYKWWIFPFQLCSVPMYLCLASPFIKSQKLLKAVCSFMMIYNLLGGFITFFEPSGINLEYWTLTLHAYVWHMTLVFVGLLIYFSGLGGCTMKDYRQSSAVFVALCAVAFAINLIFWEAAKGDINMFFVGPKNSSLAVFKTIAENFGWYVSTLVYIPAVCGGAFIIFLPFYFKNKKKKTTEVAV